MLCARTRHALLFAALAIVSLAHASPPEDAATSAAAPHTDHLGDALPEGAVRRLGTVRLRHNDGVCSVTFSADGKLLASVSRDHTVRLWESATGKEVRRFQETDCEYYSVAFAPDGKMLALAGGDPVKGGNAAVRLYDLTSGHELRRLEGHQQPAYALAFAPDGASLFSVSCGLALRWDVATGHELGRWKTPGPTGSLAVGRDLRTVAFTAGEQEDRSVRVWDAIAGTELLRLKGHKREVASVAISADGTRIASGNPFEPIRLWDAATGKLIRRFEKPEGGMALTFAPNGKLLAGACMKSGTIRLWDTATGQVVRSLSGYQGWVNGLAFSPDGKILALAGADTHCVHVWEVATGKDLRPRHGHQGQVETIAYSPDGKLLASAGGDRHHEDTAIRLWDPATGQERRRLVGHAGNVQALAFAPDGKLLASGGEKEDFVRLWDPQRGTCVRRLSHRGKDDKGPPERRISALAFAPDGKSVAAALNDGELIVFDVEGRTVRCRLEGHEARITSLAFSPDGRWLASGGLDRTARLWDVDSGKEVRQFGNHEDTVRAVAFSPDGRMLAVGACDWEGISLWETASGKALGRIAIEQGRLYDLAFTPDGRTLAVGCAGEGLRLFEVATRKERRQLPGHVGGIRALAFAPDGKLLASASADSTVLLWDLLSPPLWPGRETSPQQVGTVPQPGARLAGVDLEELWTDLAGEDAVRAERAIRTLLAAPDDALPFLKERLRPAPVVSAERLAQMVQDLDSTRYQVRHRATTELERLGELAEPLLRRQQNEPDVSLEVQRRVQQLLDRLDTATLSPANLRVLRAFEVLERLGTPEARALFEAHARAAAGARLGEEARASLERLGRRGR
ncbi:MAG: WD40 repeat domain-containing protein [Gemmataceae bacterium]|nr:WD40 repeat domain-containing protein [Gemmataceae bacterium]